MLNKCSFIGNLTKDPEMRFTTEGSAVTKFTIACNEKRKDKSDHVEFIRCVAWGRQAEICGEYLKKGKQIYVESRVRNTSYEKDGATVYSTEYHVNEMKMLGQKASNDGT